jgi:GT2 family glycosyltransferase
MSTIKEKISVVTINYNSTEKLKRLIKSLDNINEQIYEIIVIDNNSSDTKHFSTSNKKVRFIKNSNNTGFAKAVNQGIDESKTDIILLINPDCELRDKSPLKSYSKIIKNKNIGTIGGRILNPETLQDRYTATSKPGFLTALFEFTNLKKIVPENIYSKRFWIEKTQNIKTPIKVHSLCGAYMFIRKKPKVRFCEDYFLYMEDVDFGSIIKSNDLETWFDPESSITHVGGHSSNSKYKIVLKHWYKSRKIYFRKHLGPLLGNILWLLFTVEETFLTLYHRLKNTPNE